MVDNGVRRYLMMKYIFIYFFNGKSIVAMTYQESYMGTLATDDRYWYLDKLHGISGHCPFSQTLEWINDPS